MLVNVNLDIDECDLGTDNCPINASCHNTDGSFDCLCPEFYKLGGTNSKPECVGNTILIVYN